MTLDPDDDASPSAHYFDDQPSVPSDPIEIDVVLPDTAFSLMTDRGVFSRGHVDAGTNLLLRHELPLVASGHVVDLGCGAGPIALAMARRSPDATVWAVDVNARARDLCTQNAKRNGITNIRVVSPDEVPSDLSIDTMWSNPPIRIGKQALHVLLIEWLGRLAPGGNAAFVVQKHLGADSLRKWIVEQGFSVERLTSKAGFRLLAVRHGAQPHDV